MISCSVYQTGFSALTAGIVNVLENHLLLSTMICAVKIHLGTRLNFITRKVATVWLSKVVIVAMAKYHAYRNQSKCPAVFELK